MAWLSAGLWVGRLAAGAGDCKGDVAGLEEGVRRRNGLLVVRAPARVVWWLARLECIGGCSTEAWLDWMVWIIFPHIRPRADRWDAFVGLSLLVPVVSAGFDDSRARHTIVVIDVTHSRY